jgi:uncharacterized UBP type Zn finger protein
MTDRVLALSIPQQSSSKIKLEDILLDYFYNSVITGVKRQVERRMSLARSNSKTTNTIDPEKKQPISVPQASEEEVTAWQVLELIPFYSATNEQGESIQTQSDASFPDTHIILPIVLKRYQYDHAGGSTKLSRRVEIPSTIDFNRFVNQNFDDPTCPTCGQMIDWTLHIKSAVCHKGNSPSSGHYIAYSRVPVDGDEYVWLKLGELIEKKKKGGGNDGLKMALDR